MAVSRRRIRRGESRPDAVGAANVPAAPLGDFADELERLVRRLGLVNLRLGVHLVTVHGVSDACALMRRVAGRVGMLFGRRGTHFGVLFVGATVDCGSGADLVRRLSGELGDIVAAASGRKVFAEARSRLMWSHEVADPQRLISWLAADPPQIVGPALR